MSLRRAPRAGFGVCAILWASLATAEPCPRRQPEAGAPLRIPRGVAALGAFPEACPATEVSVNGWAAALIAEEDFYGYLNAGVSPRLRVALKGGPWVSIWLPGAEHWFVANASVEAEATGLGAGALGAHVPLQLGHRVQLAPFTRLLLPTERFQHRATRYGFDHGFSVVWRVLSVLEVIGGSSFPVLLSVNHPTVHIVYLPSFVADVVFEPWRFLAIAAGSSIRLRSGDDDSLESVDLRTGVRLYFGGGSRLELSAALPVAGADRTDLALAASFAWLWPPE